MPSLELPEARIRDLDTRIAPLLDNFHVTWLEKEKDRWVEGGWITEAHKQFLGTDIGFVPNFPKLGKKNKSSKRAILDVFVVPRDAGAPTLIVECGGLPDEKDMLSDMRTWFRKGRGLVNKVILMIWIMLPGNIMGGRIEVYEFDNANNKENLVQEWIYVPENEDSGGQAVRVTLGELYGIKANLLPEHERGIIIDMFIENLYDDSIEAIRTSCLHPADEQVPLECFQNKKRLAIRPGGGFGPGSMSNCHNQYDSHNVSYDNSQHTTQHFTINVFPQTPAEFLNVIHNLKHKNPAFADNTQKNEAEARKFAKNINPALEHLQLEREDTIDLVNVALYDVICLCDDSGSMNLDNRNDLLAETIYRILPVATRLNEAGVSLRFINYNLDKNFDDLTTPKQVQSALRMVQPAGTTRIGTVLKHKIVKPILTKARAGTLQSPVLVVIITDGEPSREPLNTLKNTILECKRALDEITNKNGCLYGKSSVVFQISHVGDSVDAGRFVHHLSVDPELRGMVYCNKTKLDEQLAGNSSTRKNRSLLQLLMAAINN